MGIVLDPTNIQAGNKYVKASKYSWDDRWNMFFDSLGAYYGSAHPDFISNGDTAFGSFKQYWKEASNGKFEVVPYVTHPDEIDYKLRTGIINSYQLINGVPIIKCFKMPKKKYGDNNSNSYFRDFLDTTTIESASNSMNQDVINIIDSQTDFDLNSFKEAGGILFVYFAGSHGKFKDASYAPYNIWMSPIRLREEPITSPDSRIDGFGVTAHQYGHIQFGWSHTHSGRCDIMNGGDIHDNNLPQLPNPVYRMLEGWLNPVTMDSSQLNIELPPVETSYKCGVVTIYGKPSAAPDWSTGECYVVENRRRLGFDRKMISEELDPFYPNFKGGLLVWHYSPYKSIPDPYGISGGLITLHPSDGFQPLAQNRGHPESFFAWKEGGGFEIHNFDSTRTHSGLNFPTGIELRNIEQNNYDNSLYSAITFNLNYLIRPPKQYSNVIYDRDLNNHMINYSDTVFYHRYDPKGFFNFNAGNIIESPRSLFEVRNSEFHGTIGSPILISGVGYTTEKNIVNNFRFQDTIGYLNIDSIILDNVKILNAQNVTTLIKIRNNGYSQHLRLKNILASIIDIEANGTFNLTDNYFSEIELSNINLRLNYGTNYFSNSCVFENSNIEFNQCRLIFDGPNSLLSLKPNSSVKFMSDTLGLNFNNGARISLNGVNFNTATPNTRWKGISLENSGIDSIINCSFSNAKTAITIKNNPSSSFTNRVIKNNTFNVPTGGDFKGIYGENNYKILIQDNVFNMPVTTQGSPFYTGVYLKNSSTSGQVEAAAEQEEEATSSPYSLNIIHNTFNYGSGSLLLLNYTSNVLPYYIKSNTFNSAATIGLLCTNMSGTIRDNVTTNLTTPSGIHLANSSPNLFNNSIFSRDVSLHTVGHCYPNLAPYLNNNKLIWTGGKNRFSTQLYDNIQLASKGNVYTNFGENRFNAIYTGAYHIYGWLDTSITTYTSINNCWYPGGNARIYLRHSLLTPPIPTVTGVTTIDCDHEIDPNGWVVDYLGNGVYDSVMIANDNTGQTPSTEDILYDLGNQYFGTSLFLDAISSYKNLIDNYPDYIDLPRTALNLYSCYEYLDTVQDQSERNTLYGNLKIYAEAIINSEVYKNEGGKQFQISNDKFQIEKQLNDDQFQVSSYELLLEELKELKELQRLNEIINNDPVMSKMKTSFEKSSVERKENIERRIQRDSRSEEKIQLEIKKSNELDKSKEVKARRNLFELKNMSGENLERRRIEDMMLSIRGFQNVQDKNENVNIPVEYSLSQNYPNPFNPSTNLEFGISKLGFVTLKIYDVLGKEIQTLVNEVKPAGRYSVTFDGSNLSSGIYFYKIEAGDFVQVKRMMLLK